MRTACVVNVKEIDRCATACSTASSCVTHQGGQPCKRASKADFARDELPLNVAILEPDSAWTLHRTVLFFPSQLRARWPLVMAAKLLFLTTLVGVAAFSFDEMELALAESAPHVPAGLLKELVGKTKVDCGE
eukprot:4737035-Amphidinium_carterae.1